MTMSDGDLVLRLRVEDLIAEYSHVIDDDRLEEWPDLFTPDGIYRITTRENHDAGLPLSLIYCDGRGMMADRISALRTANIYEPQVYCHGTSAVRVLGQENGVIRVRSNFTILRTTVESDSIVFACGRMFDRIVDDGGRLRFAERVAVLDSRRIETLLVIPL
ncbi:MAG: aromatic-ring-hydroxylating dioxygenase subunit beta [Aquisalimonadaceae bacterium]